MQIVSRQSSSAQALQKITSCDTLAKLYQFKIGKPFKLQAAKIQSPAVLTEQKSVQAGQKLSKHQLSTTQNMVIGRHPECQIVLADNLTLLSGFHAKIQPILSNSPSNFNWQICDRSTDGTYINGKRLQGCQTLQPGDRITLAAPCISSSSPEFIFEYQSLNNGDRNQLADCDILCLVVSASQPLTTELLVLGLTIIFYTLFTVLVYAWQKENQLKLEEATEKIKEKISNYYQSAAKNLVEKIVQDFSMKLEAEEQRVKEAMETVSEQFTDHLTELEKSELAIKLNL